MNKTILLLVLLASIASVLTGGFLGRNWTKFPPLPAAEIPALAAPAPKTPPPPPPPPPPPRRAPTPRRPAQKTPPSPPPPPATPRRQARAPSCPHRAKTASPPAAPSAGRSGSCSQGTRYPGHRTPRPQGPRTNRLRPR